MAVNIIVTAYLHRRAKGKRVKIVADSPLDCPYLAFALAVNPILTNLNKAGGGFQPLAEFHIDEEDTQDLIPLAGSQHIEARFLLVGAVKGINHFEVGFAVGASATLGSVVGFPLMTAVHTGTFVGFGVTIGEMFNAVAESPFFLLGSERAKIPSR
jgi:hypothetical protein